MCEMCAFGYPGRFSGGHQVISIFYARPLKKNPTVRGQAEKYPVRYPKMTASRLDTDAFVG